MSTPTRLKDCNDDRCNPFNPCARHNLTPEQIDAIANNTDQFTRAYVECALWSSTDDDGTPLDDGRDRSDIAPATLADMAEDCRQFQADNVELLAQAYDLYSHNSEWTHEAQAGHDFWLTRNGHGVGFWDRGLGIVGDRLTDAAHVWGSYDLYVGDDGLVYA